MQFQLSPELIEKIELLVEERNDKELLLHLQDLHHADIAEILEELGLDESTYIIKLLDSEKTAEVLMELHEDDREKILNNRYSNEMADELEEMDSDDAADILAEHSEERKEEVIASIEDTEHAEDLKEVIP